MNNNEGKFKRFLKKSGKYIIAIVLAVAIASAIGVTAAFSAKSNKANINQGPGSEQETPVSGQTISFGLPMNNCTVLNDFFDSELVYNLSMNEWAVHLGLDLTSEDLSVLAVADGTVESVDYDTVSGYTVKLSHADGFVSVYSSLDEEVLVKEGDVLKKGAKVGTASQSAGSEAKQDAHLHFELYLNDVEVDPNNYLELSNK